MIQNIKFINIKEALSRTLRHPLLQEVTLELTILYVLDFIGIFGLGNMYSDKEVTLTIKDYMALLPSDLISINQVKNTKTDLCLNSMTDTFKSEDSYYSSFKVLNRVIVTSFKEGEIIVSYKAIPVDDNGLPLLINNSVYLKCLDYYIKKEVFTILFDMGKIQSAVLNNTQQLYHWLAGLLLSEFTIPSISEMESLKNSWCTLISRDNEFRKGFKHLGDLEFIRVL